VIDAVRERLRQQGHAYRHGEDRPLGGYLTLMSVYAGATGAAAVVARAFGRTAPQLSTADLGRLVVATFGISRLLAKDPVTSPFRAPFTTFAGTSAPGELAEEVRGDGLRHSVGELVTCPMCLSQWVATGLYFGLVFAPVPARAVLTIASAVAGSDALHHAYVRLQQATE
jgi:hypothetical protein